MLNVADILETIGMIREENLDIRTITMGISLLDCVSEDPGRLCDKIYDKMMKKAERLVSVGVEIEREYGVPIVNKRVSLTPVSLVGATLSPEDYVRLAQTLEKAAGDLGVNFIGGYSALVHKGMTPGEKNLILSIPEALATTEHICSSVNVATTKAGINMDAIRMLGQTVKDAAYLTRDRSSIGCAKLVVFANAPEDNPFMAGAFHGVGEPDTVINVGVSGPGVMAGGQERAIFPRWPMLLRKLPLKSHGSGNWWPEKRLRGLACRSALSICPWRRPRPWAIRWHVYWKKWGFPAAAGRARLRRWPCSMTR